MANSIKNMILIHHTSQELPDVSKLSHDECAADFIVRRRTRKRYPGACSLEFQNVMDIVLKCLLNWDNERKESLGTGMVGDLVAWNHTVEEQGRGSLHAHWQLFTKQLSTKARLKLFQEVKVVRDTARRELVDYIDSMVCASYGSEIDIVHNCSNQTPDKSEWDEMQDQTAKEMAPENSRYFSRQPQVFRNARNKYCNSDGGGCLSVCNKCGALIKYEDIPENFYRQQSSKRWVSNMLQQYCFKSDAF